MKTITNNFIHASCNNKTIVYKSHVLKERLAVFFAAAQIA